MSLNGDDAEVHRKVPAERDTYAASADVTMPYLNIDSHPGPKIRADEDMLAALVLHQAQDKRARLIGTDRPGDDTANIGYSRVPGRLREADGRDIGDLRSILEYYQSLSPQRLVILGAPGTGKTVLLLELQIRLLIERGSHPEEPVPILISAAAYDTAKPWEDWLAEQVSLEFSFPKRRTAALVSAGRILPLVDGLDEMDPAGDSTPERAQALVRALNESMRGLRLSPVVVTCRQGEYSRLAEGIDKARHAELSGLIGPEAAAYLRGQFRTSDELGRWKPVLETLEQDPDGPLAAELATPWKLTLALTVFRDCGDPTQLLPSAGSTGSNYSAHIDGLLLGGYVPAAVRLSQKGERYTHPKVKRWLTFLADGLVLQARSGRSATDIILYEWRRTRTAQISYAALVLVPFLLLSYMSSSTLNAALIAIFALSASGAFSPRTFNSPEIFGQRKPTGSPRLSGMSS